jgi:hypothetical protein
MNLSMSLPALMRISTSTDVHVELYVWACNSPFKRNQMKKIIKKSLLMLSGATILLAEGCTTTNLQTISGSNTLMDKDLIAALPALDTARVAVDKVIKNAKSIKSVCGDTPMPTILKDLNQNDVFSSNITLSVNSSLSAYGFSGTMGKKDILVSSYFIKFKDYPCGDGTTKKVLVGMRLYVHASDLKVKISSPSIGTIAAAAELGLAKSEYRLRTFGLNPTDFYLSLPGSTFDVDNYSKVISAYDKILHSLSDNTPIDPIIEDVHP